MDKRWKSVERKVAKYLTSISAGLGYKPIERIAINGREGPDLTINEFGLVVNVKSRKVIPDRLFAKDGQGVACGGLVGWRMKDLRDGKQFLASETPGWKMLFDWYDLMDQWTKEFAMKQITAIILHRPNMPIGHSTLIIHRSNTRRLYDKLNYHSQCGG